MTDHAHPRFPWPDVLAVAALVALVLAFFWRLAFTNLILPRGDVFTYFYPLWQYRHEMLRAGHLPLWNPYLFMGVPFLANSQAGVLYPPNWLLIPFDAPTAVKIAILAHALWAAMGMFAFARRSLRLTVLASTLAACVFALGGYVTAQAEHVNQLQGLAWLPWLFLCYTEALGGKRRAVIGLALALAMQLLAGHTQSAFISGVGLGLWGLWHAARALLPLPPPPERGPGGEGFQVGQIIRSLAPLGLLALAALFALGLAAAQLLPTFELARLSNRGGGLPFLDALSFSLRPQILGRSLLPDYTHPGLFSEYVAYVGVAALTLALIGLISRRHDRNAVGLAMLTAIGLFLALGAYNPAYWLLVKLVPGFDLFRAPARWLAFYALGMAALSGYGLDSILSSSPSPKSERGPGGEVSSPSPKQSRFARLSGEGNPGRARIVKTRGLRPFARGRGMSASPSPLRGRGGRGVRGALYFIPALTTLLLALLTPLAPLAIDDVPGAFLPSPEEIVLWIVFLVASLALTCLAMTARPSARQIALPALAALAVVELFLASRTLPYNRLTAPTAWTSQRPAISTLLAAQQGQTPPARFLSISDILFDPGDLREIEAIYRPYLSDDELYDFIIATKHKEILAPNLPLAWRIPAMDGFDGGILPLRDYTRFTALFLPADAVSPDGRLRENLRAVPDWYWLSLANVRYVITDKVYDAWIDGVYYDLQFTARQHNDPSMPAPPPIDARPPQAFEATAVGIVGHLEGAASVPDGAQIGSVAIYGEGIQSPLDAIVLPLIVGRDLAEGDPAAAQHSTPEVAGYFTPDQPDLAEYRALLDWGGTPLTVERVEVSTVSSFSGTLVVRGMTLVDGRSGAFLPLRLPPDVRLIQSGDVKIYEYTAALPRAYVVCSPILAADEVEMGARMRDARRPVILDPNPIVGPPCDPHNPGTATITAYEPERVVIQVESQGMGAYLILSDAWYPGWTATVDGEPAEVLRANGMFRAVRLPLDGGEVVFEYRGRIAQIGAAISGVFLLLAVGGLLGIRRI